MPIVRTVELIFHHIYSRNKRQAIAGWALDGPTACSVVLKTGRPGRLLAIGQAEAVHDLINLTKRLRWQSCRLEHTADHQVDDGPRLEGSYEEVETSKDWQAATTRLRLMCKASCKE